jgi:hypothetical protein
MPKAANPSITKPACAPVSPDAELIRTIERMEAIIRRGESVSDTELIAASAAYLAAEDEQARLYDARIEEDANEPEIEAQSQIISERYQMLCETPAHTTEGVRAKAAALYRHLAFHFVGGELIDEEHALAWSLCRDILEEKPATRADR